jgi:hypothetical protein
MTTTRRLILIAAAAAALAVAGCSKTPSPGAGAAPAGPAPSASVDAGTADATAAYITALGEVDRKLVSDTRTALDNGMATCVDIDERRPDAEQEKNVATRFAVPAAEAKKVLAVAKDNLCLE